MTKKNQYLIFGDLAPITSPASSLTTQLARWLANDASVTVVIADQAPCSPEPDAMVFSVLRERDLAEATLKKDHKRLFVLGDSYQSLWALRHYKALGGSVLPAAKTLSNLHRLYHEQQANWPEAYASWLENNLNAAGGQMANALVHHRRESKAILREIPIGIIGAAHEDPDFINPDDILCSPPPFDQSYLFNEPSMAASNSKKPFVAVLLTPSEQQALDELLELDKETLPPFNLHIVTGNEVDLPDHIAAADILLVLDRGQTIPAGFLYALSNEVPVITCSQPWLADLPFKAGLNIKHSGACHELKAALGALLVSTELRHWASEQSKALYSALPIEKEQEGFLKSVLARKYDPINLAKASKKKATPSTSVPTDMAFKASSEKRPFALIGSVPPQAIAEVLLPFVDCTKSPRFATPEVALELCGEKEVFPANKLALLGYEAPIIGKGHSSWKDIQHDLKNVENAICFGPHAEGTIAAESFIGRGDLPNFKVALDFECIDTPSTTTYQSKVHGLYWKRDTIEHSIEAILVAGLSGTYRCSMQAKNIVISLSQATGTYLLTNKKPVELLVDKHGILKCNISVYDSSNMNQLTDTLLISSLATLTLDLEWLGYGE